MPYETINRRKIYYEMHGDGEETIILMHHGFGCLKIWKDIYPQLVSEGYHVVMFDRRGFGRSEAGDDFQEFYESEERYRPESVVELRELKIVLGIGRCHLVGQCEGGVVAVDYAAKYPDEVMTVSTGSTQCYSTITLTEMNAQKFVPKFADLEPKLQLKMTDWHGDNAAARYEQFAKYGGAYGVNFFDLRPALRHVVCPALVLYPDRSAIFDVEQSIAFYRGLPRGELAVFPKCGHNTYEQRPEDYGKTLLDFLKRHRPGAETKERPAMSCLA